MNDGIFRRDARPVSLSTAAQHQLSVQDASRAFAPEPPAAMPLGPPDHVPAAQPLGGGGDLPAIAYARHLISVYGADQAVAIIGAEARALRAQVR